MKTGNIILVPFPFSELTNIKVRPAVVISTTKDKYEDVIVSAISSVIPDSISANEIIIESNSINNLRVKSVLKVDRIVTIKKESVIAMIGNLSENELNLFKSVFKDLVK
ncbi:MAG: type II toxin-antitoxin system PemK/MazF family toxin [Ignavibacteria bacterium]|nr:type II toxin-antitoxin system PemK/MazF family toxin [Ignavibacteria bacterium]MBK8382506.1 type II toxin-antitoxin system PemK/MazF family toxin [Ignavibacteria bacterium]